MYSFKYNAPDCLVVRFYSRSFLIYQLKSSKVSLLKFEIECKCLKTFTIDNVNGTVLQQFDIYRQNKTMTVNRIERKETHHIVFNFSSQ